MDSLKKKVLWRQDLPNCGHYERFVPVGPLGGLVFKPGEPLELGGVMLEFVLANFKDQVIVLDDEEEVKPDKEVFFENSESQTTVLQEIVPSEIPSLHEEE